VAEEDSWRLGFSIADHADPATWGKQLGASWYFDWNARDAASPPGLTYWRTVRVGLEGVSPGLDTLSLLAARYPGGHWIVGNEPDVVWQDNVPADVYAARYGAVYAALKAADPSARVAVGAIAQVTPLRLQYLDEVLEAYQLAYGESLPADLWTVHMYVLPEVRDEWGIGIPPGFDVRQGQIFSIEDHDRLDLFEQQIVTFRAWLSRHGYRDKPLVLTELGILMYAEYGFTPDRVVAYLRSTFDVLVSLADPEIGMPGDGGRMVQQWAWFSLSYAPYPTSNLADLDRGRLTPVGEAYRDYALALRGDLPGMDD
jgi:hypothetical protein